MSLYKEDNAFRYTPRDESMRLSTLIKTTIGNIEQSICLDAQVEKQYPVDELPPRQRKRRLLEMAISKKYNERIMKSLKDHVNERKEMAEKRGKPLSNVQIID